MTGYVLLISTVVMLAMPLARGTAHGRSLEDVDGPWRRDPFRYKVTESKHSDVSEKQKDEPGPETMPQGLNLKGIILARDGKYRALINDREFKEGDQVGEQRILGISRFEIVVEDETGTRTIDLFHHQIKWGDQ